MLIPLLIVGLTAGGGWNKSLFLFTILGLIFIDNKVAKKKSTQIWPGFHS